MKRQLISVITTVACLDPACRLSTNSSDLSKDVAAFGEELKAAILDRDLKYLTQAAGFDDRMSSHEFAQSDIYKFLYDGLWMRLHDSESRSVEEILKNEARVVVVPVPSTRSGIINMYHVVFLSPEVRSSDLQNPWFWQDNWMERFVSCLVSRDGGRWRMVSSFCYAETEGPGNLGGG